MTKARTSQKHTRSESSFTRRSATRPTRKLVLLACEGAETEPRYFKALAQRLQLSVTVRAGTGGSPGSTVSRAIAETRHRRLGADDERYDEVWCILDTEGSVYSEELRRAADKARGAHFGLAVSNPSFEFWYVLHFEDTSRPFANGDEVERFLKKHVPNYRKNQDLFEAIYPSISVAIYRAETLISRLASDTNPYPNPSTTVHILARMLINISSQQ